MIEESKSGSDDSEPEIQKPFETVFFVFFLDKQDLIT